MFNFAFLPQEFINEKQIHTFLFLNFLYNYPTFIIKQTRKKVLVISHAVTFPMKKLSYFLEYTELSQENATGNISKNIF